MLENCCHFFLVINFLLCLNWFAWRTRISGPVEWPRTQWVAWSGPSHGWLRVLGIGVRDRRNLGNVADWRDCYSSHVVVVLARRFIPGGRENPFILFVFSFVQSRETWSPWVVDPSIADFEMMTVPMTSPKWEPRTSSSTSAVRNY